MAIIDDPQSYLFLNIKLQRIILTGKNTWEFIPTLQKISVTMQLKNNFYVKVSHNLCVIELLVKC